MSVIAIRWAYSRPISNPVAKHVLIFLCTHDFPGNKSVFKLNTICDAICYKRRSVTDAITCLVEQGYITKNERHNEDNGQQLSNQYTIMIDEEYVQDFCKSYDLSTRGVHQMHGGGASDARGGVHEVHTYKNNAFKSNKKKSSCASPFKDQKPGSKSKTSGTRHEHREDNEKKHHWAANAKVCEPVTQDAVICGGCKRPDSGCTCAKIARLEAHGMYAAAIRDAIKGIGKGKHH